jgi:predicted porin
VNDIDDAETDGTSNGNSPSRFGIRTSRDLGELTGTANLEYEVTKVQADDAGLRLANVGLEGAFGSVMIGSQWNPHYLWTTATTDLFTSSAAFSARSTDANFRDDGSVFYYTPSLNGLELGIGAEFDPNNDTSDDYDSYTLSARYSIGGLYLSASYIEADTDETLDSLAVAASYDFGVASVAASVADNTNDTAIPEDELASYNSDGSPYEIAVSVPVTSAFTVLGAYTDRDFEGSSEDSSFAVEGTYAFGAGVTGFLSATSSDDEFGREDALATGLQVVF